MFKLSSLKTLSGFALGGALGFALTQQLWALKQLASIDVWRALETRANRTPAGLDFSQSEETSTYLKTHTVEDGIERIVYRPKHRRFDTPIVMQHGMWHGAWSWEPWQALFAEWGWESRAHSLPGHAASPVQRPIARCTLDYYLVFFKQEILRSPRPPVLMGHSMGGALIQWYFKYVDDNLPAAVLVAPWVSHSMFKDGLWPLLRFDPLCAPLMMKTWDATPMARPGRGSAVRFLLEPDDEVSLAELQPRLGPESLLVLYQHNPPFWYPPSAVKTPLLWIAGEKDPLLREAAERRSAQYYGADYFVAKNARHNVMMARNQAQTARFIHNWLKSKNVH